MSRLLILLFGVAGYAAFLATFLYLVGFVSGLVVPVTVDHGGPAAPWPTALLIDAGLVALFGLQHTVMARPAFKRAFTRLVPGAIERTCFVVVTCGVFALMFTQWRPIPTVLWSSGGAIAMALHGVAFTGWTIVLLSTFLIDHFDLFGLRQVWLAFRGRPYTQRTFQERSLYRLVRHPLMLGFLIAFWAAPTMTLGRFAFAACYTIYILLALLVEERDLVALHGPAYRDYQRRVPRLLPLPAGGGRDTERELTAAP
jgi:protein-S-isoprenylcysteine O-methyltransferase Ste14